MEWDPSYDLLGAVRPEQPSVVRSLYSSFPFRCSPFPSPRTPLFSVLPFPAINRHFFRAIFFPTPTTMVVKSHVAQLCLHAVLCLCRTTLVVDLCDQYFVSIYLSF